MDKTPFDNIIFWMDSIDSDPYLSLSEEHLRQCFFFLALLAMIHFHSAYFCLAAQPSRSYCQPSWESKCTWHGQVGFTKRYDPHEKFWDLNRFESIRCWNHPPPTVNVKQDMFLVDWLQALVLHHSTGKLWSKSLKYPMKYTSRKHGVCGKLANPSNFKVLGFDMFWHIAGSLWYRNLETLVGPISKCLNFIVALRKSTTDQLLLTFEKRKLCCHSPPHWFGTIICLVVTLLCLYYNGERLTGMIGPFQLAWFWAWLLPAPCPQLASLGCFLRVLSCQNYARTWVLNITIGHCFETSFEIAAHLTPGKKRKSSRNYHFDISSWQNHWVLLLSISKKSFQGVSSSKIDFDQARPLKSCDFWKVYADFDLDITSIQNLTYYQIIKHSLTPHRFHTVSFCYESVLIPSHPCFFCGQHLFSWRFFQLQSKKLEHQIHKIVWFDTLGSDCRKNIVCYSKWNMWCYFFFFKWTVFFT